MKVVGVAFAKGNLVLSMQRPKRHCDIIAASEIELHDWEQADVTRSMSRARRSSSRRTRRLA